MIEILENPIFLHINYGKSFNGSNVKYHLPIPKPGCTEDTNTNLVGAILF